MVPGTETATPERLRRVEEDAARRKEEYEIYVRRTASRRRANQRKLLHPDRDTLCLASLCRAKRGTRRCPSPRSQTSRFNLGAESTWPETASSGAGTPRALPRSVLAAALIGAGLVAGLAMAAVWGPGTETPVDAARYAQFCTPVPAAAVAPEADPSDRRIDVLVPRDIVAPELDGAAHATRIARGEVVEFRSLRRSKVQPWCTACPIWS